jgi:hypothetical protein
MRSISVKMWAKFPLYGDIFIAPEALTIWAKYAIYEGIDKIPQICRHMDSMWSKMYIRWSKISRISSIFDIGGRCLFDQNVSKAYGYDPKACSDNKLL